MPEKVTASATNKNKNNLGLNEQDITIEDKISSHSSDKDERSNINRDISKSNDSDGDSSSLEKEDKKRVNVIRTDFYQLNEKFEQLLKFKPLKQLQLWTLEYNLMASYHIFHSLKLEEKVHSMSE